MILTGGARRVGAGAAVVPGRDSGGCGPPPGGPQRRHPFCEWAHILSRQHGGGGAAAVGELATGWKPALRTAAHAGGSSTQVSWLSVRHVHLSTSSVLLACCDWILPPAAGGAAADTSGGGVTVTNALNPARPSLHLSNCHQSFDL